MDVDECVSEPEIKTEVQKIDLTTPANDDTFVDVNEAKTQVPQHNAISVPSVSGESVTKSLPITTIKVYNSKKVFKDTVTKQKLIRSQTASSSTCNKSEPFVTVLLPMANDDELNVEEKYDHLPRSMTDETNATVLNQGE